MKKILTLAFTLAIAGHVFSQGKAVEKIKASVTASSIEAHITFLAADEMRGRDTGSPEAAIAANYIAAQFKIAGLKQVPGINGWSQQVGLERALPTRVLDVKIGNDLFAIKKDLVLLRGKSVTWEGDFVFLGYGTSEEFNAADVKGKVVVCYAGSSDKSTLRSAIRTDSPPKYELAKARGAAAIIEIANFTDLPWEVFVGYLSGSSVAISGGAVTVNDIPQLWLHKSDAAALTELVQQKKAHGKMVVERPLPKVVEGRNIIGWVEGTDPKLRDEYIVLSAHYDHIGVRKGETADSIYNGARDNAIGTTAIIEAAAYIAKYPTKRSVLIVAYCAEEVGLLGSRRYSEHPVIPLNKTVYNLDCDGAGYDDKTIVSLIDLNRTTADETLRKAVAAFGLTLKGDPAPDQNLYERSDNYNFAVKGVPAVDFAPGISAFTEELMKYYHQAADEASSLDYEYLEKFIRAYVCSATSVADMPVRPTWKAGDKFEAAGKTLYGK